MTTKKKKMWFKVIRRRVYTFEQLIQAESHAQAVDTAKWMRDENFLELSMGTFHTAKLDETK